MPLVKLENGEYLCYKIVAEETGGAFTSCIIDDPRLSVQYRMNDWARSVCDPSWGVSDYGLLAFMSFRTAKSWCDRSLGHVVFEAVGRGLMSVKKYPKHCVVYTDRVAGNPNWWSTVGHSLDGSWPRGTVMFREVKLLARAWG